MGDKILEMLFDVQRWSDALNKGAMKGINEVVLRELMSPQGRQKLMLELLAGQYRIERPYTAKIPKDTPGEYRTVFVNTGRDRVFLSLVNDLLFDICKDMVHPKCVSYQKGIGCASIVSVASKLIERMSGETHEVMGWKSDLSKYFDSVPIRYIDAAFDEVERRHGHSCVIDAVREYYHNDCYYDSEEHCEKIKYQSLKQGCAVASWLADVILFYIDSKLDSLNGYYVRYSDDTLFVGTDYAKAMEIMRSELGAMEMKLNPKKVEYLTNDKWFKFLGYSIKGSQISLSNSRLKNFGREVAKRTISKIRQGVTFEQALRSVQRWMYYGDGEHSWATGVLKTINVPEDINTLNTFVIDCLRAVKVGKPVRGSDIGGLGWVKDKVVGCIERGRGKRVNTLRSKTEKSLDGYYTLSCMRNNLLISRDLYDSIVRDI